MMEDGKIRCDWATGDPLYQQYHDREWGVPVFDDRLLFEFVVLEGAQAGLSWLTILKRREGYRRAFEGFHPEKIARYDEAKIAELLEDKGIIRNRLKVNSAITNARFFLEIQQESGSFADYIWGFVGGKTKINRWKSMEEIPATTPESDAMSKELKKRGFKFMGSTISYAHMQATGMVNDHIVSCFRHSELIPS